MDGILSAAVPDCTVLDVLVLVVGGGFAKSPQVHPLYGYEIPVVLYDIEN